MTDLKSSFPSDPDVLAVFRQELARAAAVRSLAAAPALWPRFAGYYHGLARLPRRVRRLKYLGVFLFALAMLVSRAQAIDSDDLAMAVIASSDPVVPGRFLLYQFTATNRGIVPTTGGVTVRGLIPEHTFFIDATDAPSCPGGTCNSGEFVTWSLPDLPAGISRTVSLSLEVIREFLAPPDGTLILQQATVASEGLSMSTEHSVVVQRTPEFSLGMKADRHPVDPGVPLTYTVVFGNRGNLLAPGVTLHARVPAGTSFQSASDGGTQGGGVVTWSLGTVGVGKSGERQFTVIVDPQIAASEILLSDAEILDSAAPAPNSARSAIATAVTRAPNLGLAITADRDPVIPGGLVVYHFTATNHGIVPTTGGVTLRTLFPEHTFFVDATDPPVCRGGTCNSGEFVTWSLPDLPAGISRTVSLSLEVIREFLAPPDGTLILQQATINAVPGSTSAVSRVCRGGGTSCDFDGLGADVSITKADAPDPVFVGQPLTYTLTVRNNGPNNATGATATDPLPGGVTLVSATASQGACSGTSTVVCALGSLGNGASATVTIVVTPTSPGALSNTASVTGNPSDPNLGDNSATSATTVLPVPDIRADLALTQTDSPDPGAVADPLVYTLTVTNNGPSTATGVQVTDSLPAGVVLAGPAIPSQGTCEGTGPVVCHLGTLVSGASATVTINVLPTQAGAVSNAASVVGVEPDITPGNNSASSTTTINDVAVVPPPQGSCNRTACGVQLTCTLGAPCADRRVTLFVPGRTVRLSEGALANAPARIKFAFGVANIPPSETRPVRLRLTSRGKTIISTFNKKRIKAFMEIRNAARTPISTTRITIRLR